MGRATVPVTKRQLAALVLGAAHIPEREVIASFILDDATEFAANPFARTSAATVRHVWEAQTFEFRALGVHVAGLTSLLAAVSALNKSEALVQEILRSGPHTLNAFHREDGCRIVGAVLYGKSGILLPELPIHRTRPAQGTRAPLTQLDLFEVGNGHA